MMQRKPTRNTRGPNAEERRFQGWVKYQPCIWCGNDGGVIVDHVKGATFKNNKVLIGHFFCLPNCEVCDDKKTIEGKKLGDYADKWFDLMLDYRQQGGKPASNDIFNSIREWGESWQNGS